MFTCLTSKASLDNGQVFDALEVFAGIGTLTRCLQLANYRAAALDIQHWEPYVQRRLRKRLRKQGCKGNPLDLLSPAGYAFLDSMGMTDVYKAIDSIFKTHCPFKDSAKASSGGYFAVQRQHYGGSFRISVFQLCEYLKRVYIPPLLPSRRGFIWKISPNGQLFSSPDRLVKT